jgi:hypothetical protein
MIKMKKRLTLENIAATEVVSHDEDDNASKSDDTSEYN